jgi:hypothetical protein
MKELRNSSTILTLRANVSESEAFGEFRSTGISTLAWRLARGPLQRLAAVYVPFALYHLRYEIGRTRHTRFFALDLVEGVLDPFEFPQAINQDTLTSIETRNYIPPVLAGDRSEFLLREKALALIFQQGFFRLRHPQLEIDCVIKQFHIPYWLGFFGRDGNLQCRALDAVRRRMEGQKATQLFEKWLAG